MFGQDAGGYNIKVDFVTRKKYISFIFNSVFKSDMTHWAEIQGKLMLEFAFYKIFTQRFSITFTEKKKTCACLSPKTWFVLVREIDA